MKPYLKRLLYLILCLMMVFTLTGCLTLLLLDELLEESDNIETENDETTESPLSDNSSYDNNDSASDAPPADDVPSAGVTPISRPLDKSSAESFITDVKETYNFVLSYEGDLLSGELGMMYMTDIEYVLAMFSPEFIRQIVTIWGNLGADFFIRLFYGSDSEEEVRLGRTLRTVFFGDLTIILYYNSIPGYNGISVESLAHEFGHAIHFSIEEFIGKTQSELEMSSFNGGLDYVGESWDYLWREEIHSSTFAYDYSMASYHEDWATIIQWLICFPEEMFERLADLRNEPLFLKTQYIRGMTYEYISDECYEVFAPLYRAEEHRLVLSVES